MAFDGNRYTRSQLIYPNAYDMNRAASPHFLKDALQTAYVFSQRGVTIATHTYWQESLDLPMASYAINTTSYKSIFEIEKVRIPEYATHVRVEASVTVQQMVEDTFWWKTSVNDGATTASSEDSVTRAPEAGSPPDVSQIFGAGQLGARGIEQIRRAFYAQPDSIDVTQTVDLSTLTLAARCIVTVEMKATTAAPDHSYMRPKFLNIFWTHDG